MPELPEVETVRLDLLDAIVGEVVVAVRVTGRRTIRRQSVSDFRESLTGRVVVDCRRHGKYLLFDLDDHRLLVVHLRMSGQLRYEPDPTSAEELHTHVVLELESGAELRFVDPRTFGEMFVADDVDGRGLPVELSGLGVDPLTDGLTAAALGSLIERRRTSLKAFLLDQSGVAGIGNIYGDEICFAARLRPDRRTESLTRSEVRRLAQSISSVLAAAVELRGSTLRDARYRDITGAAGAYQERHAVYDRTGRPCPRCGHPIDRSRLVGRSTHFCRRCQH